MALIALPRVRAKSQHLQLLRNDSALEFMSGATVVTRGTQATWLLTFPLSISRIAEARLWFGALAQLSRLSNTFQITPPAWVSGTGYDNANPVVDGANQLGTSLNCKWATQSMLIALAGDFIEVNGEFKVLTQDVTTAVDTTHTMNFEPALRQAPADLASVNIKTPQLTMRLVSPLMEFDGSLPDFFDTTVIAMEHWGP